MKQRTAQHSTAQHSTAQHSTAQHSTAQHSNSSNHSQLGEAMPPSIRLIYAPDQLSEILHKDLQSYGLEISDDAEHIILLESLQGTVVTKLEEFEFDPQKIVVFTSNTCPEYWQDVLEIPVLGLVVGSLNKSMVLMAVQALHTEKEFRYLPQVKRAELTMQERNVLRLVARSFSNKDIADMLGKSEKTIANKITEVLEKLVGTYPELRLNNRGCLVHYYYGFWSNIHKDCTYSRIAKKNRAVVRKAEK